MKTKKATARTANDIASLFLVQVLAQEKQRILRRLELLAEADQAGDEELANASLDVIGMVCVLGDVRGSISSRQWKWVRNIANQEHLCPSQGGCIVSYEGREVGFWSSSWPTEPQATMHYSLDTTVVQAYMGLPADVLARAAARCLEDGDGRPINRWMMRQQHTAVKDGVPRLSCNTNKPG